MKLNAILWGSEASLLASAAEELNIDIEIWYAHELKNDQKRLECIESFENADLSLLHPTSDNYWDEIFDEMNDQIPVVSFGYNDSFSSVSNVDLKIVSTVSTYFIYGGLENMKNMLNYLRSELLDEHTVYDLPKETYWEGIYHPDAKEPFISVEDYLKWYKSQHEHRIGILFFRSYWINKDLKIVDAIIRELEKEFSVIAAFCFGMGDVELGAKGSGDIIESYFVDRIDALIDLQSIVRTEGIEGSVNILRKLDVPVFHPVTLQHTSAEEWNQSIEGLTSAQIGWTVAMPEFKGLIEMIPVGSVETSEHAGADCEYHIPIEERIDKVVTRVKKWVALRNKPVNERRVAFILHNNACASVEATVGAGANLDTLESVARILKQMNSKGYDVEYPADGKELIENIMDHKAISEFRWTSVNEIVNKGGALSLISREDYTNWFKTLQPDIRERICEAWGNPPGEEVDGIPPAMVYDNKIVVTGVRYKNAIVCVQPKRGCAGSRCDGEVCKILHDPEIPPTHQYLATYRYIENEFKANAIIHVGTHGSLEFLPGKSVALSERCYPDIAIGTIPHLYIYNSDNPPEGTIAKRRSYATLVDHMQCVMTESDLYSGLKELEDLIGEYNLAKISDRARAHALEHIILDKIEETNISEDIRLNDKIENGIPFIEILELAHKKITQIYNTQIPDGMHIFGELPKDEKLTEYINAIMRYEGEMRRTILKMMNIDLEPSDADSSLLRELDTYAKGLISAFLNGDLPGEAAKNVLGSNLKKYDEDALLSLCEKAQYYSSLIEKSDEIGSLLHGFDGGYIEPGPSGLITGGKPEILPTGRNFYSLDPFKIPTKAAWRIGKRLAEGVLEKYLDENGKTPENVAMFWMAGDIMWSDGEQCAQIMYLIGAEPVWKNGRVKSYRIIPLEELKRPRVDVTIRVSGILRDCFYNCVELIDDAIKEISVLDEPDEMNYLKKHYSETGKSSKIFSSRPGTYGNGVKLAVYASAWKEEKDLSDVFIYWNGYAYGRDTFGEESHVDFVSQLKTVDVTFNKTSSDEHDLFGCCCYFGTHGGLTCAARTVSEKEIPAYYGDTRDKDVIEIRTLADEIRRVARTKLLNPKWIEGMKNHGYKGAGDISKRVGRIYGWEASTSEVDDWVFDDITKTFVLDEENRKFFEENNPWALEEIGRRLIEAHERGLWNTSPEIIEGLKEAYLEMEGWIEDKIGNSDGDIQGGSIDVLTVDDVGYADWKKKMQKLGL